MVTRWRDCWVTKPQDKTKKAGSSFLSKLGGGWGSPRTADVSPRSSAAEECFALSGDERGETSVVRRLGVGRKGEKSALEREKLGLGLGLGFSARHATWYLGLIVLFKLWLRNRYNTVAKSSVTHLKNIYQLLEFKYLAPSFLKKGHLQFQRGAHRPSSGNCCNCKPCTR